MLCALFSALITERVVDFGIFDRLLSFYIAPVDDNSQIVRSPKASGWDMIRAVALS